MHVRSLVAAALAGAVVLTASTSVQAAPTTASRTASTGFSTVTSPNVANSDSHPGRDHDRVAPPPAATVIGLAP